MAEKIIMPKAGMSMEQGVIVAWLKDVGDKVSNGEPLLEIETDKTVMQVESMSDGYLLKKLYDAGDEVPVVTTIGYIGELGEEIPEDEKGAPAALPEVPGPQPVADVPKKTDVSTGKILATPAARRLAKEHTVPLESIFKGEILHARDIPTESGAKLTPLAKRVAHSQNIDLSGITGSGYGGKIFRADLPSDLEPGTVRTRAPKFVKLSGMRKTIAKRMALSHTEIPSVTLNSEADVTMLAAMRDKLNLVGGVKISFNDLIIKACAVALQEFPEINSTYADDGMFYHAEVNIGMAVALENGLIVPVIMGAEKLTLKEISNRAKALAAKATDGILKPQEYSDGTFTISNLGMFGITSFTPIINQPQTCILGVCAITSRLALTSEGSVEARKYMGLSLTFDHRCIDGAGGAKFLQRLVALLENPLEML